MSEGRKTRAADARAVMETKYRRWKAHPVMNEHNELENAVVAYLEELIEVCRHEAVTAFSVAERLLGINAGDSR